MNITVLITYLYLPISNFKYFFLNSNSSVLYIDDVYDDDDSMFLRKFTNSDE